ncbi:MAG: sugar phosphate isomerase/epimerase [Acidobacteria bacterium]|nr:sugar phosphate isomerase/epimerase [Acidobacteriota bacterium]
MIHRRLFLKGGGTAIAGASRLKTLAEPARKPLFTYSICNEIFEKWDFAETCRTARKLGYAGIEISPFTLADNIDDIKPARRKELRDIIRSEGLRFVGLHWLLVTPKWLHVTTADKDVRERSWQYLGKLIEFCGELGQPAIMVFGSPKQRATGPGVNREQAIKYLTDGLAGAAPQAAARKITICLEALDHGQTDVVNTLAESVAAVKQVRHPAIQTMFDYHNVGDEKEPSEALVRRYYPMIRHVHINEMDGRHPGTGKYDFVPVLKVLKEKKYTGWVSLEVFDFKLGAERIAREAIEYIRGVEPRV